MKKYFLVCYIAVCIFVMLGGVFYSPVVFQEGNPLPLLSGILRLQTSNDGVVLISSDPEQYITRARNGNETFMVFMQNKGWSFKEQLGAGFFFERQGKSLTAVSKQYSRFFRLWKITNM